MNLIEQLGGYEKAKDHSDYLISYGSEFAGVSQKTIDEVNSALLQYRREHGIYEVGDLVIFHSLPYARLFYVKAVLDDSIVVRECWDEAGARCFSEFEPYLDIRHATEEEIKAGRRLELETLNDHDIPPNTTILER